MSLTREDLNDGLDRILAQVQSECAAIRTRQDDILAQQRIANGRTSQLEQTVAGHSVALENVHDEIWRQRDRAHKFSNFLQKVESKVGALGVIVDRVISQKTSPAPSSPGATIMTLAWLCWLIGFAVGVLALAGWLMTRGGGAPHP